GAEVAAAAEHEVAAGELVDQRHRLRAGPGQVDAGDRGGLAGRTQPEVLDADDAAEALGEQVGQDARDRLAGLLTVQPAAHAGGVGADVVGSQVPGTAVHLPGQLALGPAAALEPRGEPVIGAPGGDPAAIATHRHAPSPSST